MAQNPHCLEAFGMIFKDSIVRIYSIQFYCIETY